MNQAGQQRDGRWHDLSARGRPQARRLRRPAARLRGLTSAARRKSGIHAVDASLCPLHPEGNRATQGRGLCPQTPTKGRRPLEPRQGRRPWNPSVGVAGRAGDDTHGAPRAETWPWLIQPPRSRAKGGMLECVAGPSSLLAAGSVVEAKSECALFSCLRGGVQFNFNTEGTEKKMRSRRSQRKLSYYEHYYGLCSFNNSFSP
jgi:hypothetical protein